MVKLLAAVTGTLILLTTALARTGQSETYFTLNQSNLDGNCRSAINQRINSVDNIPWWARPIARRIATNDVEAITLGETTPAAAAQDLYEFLVDKGMEEGWAADIRGKYRSALQQLTSEDGEC